jgi:hypothetical protein
MGIHAQRDFVSASYLSIASAVETYLPISASSNYLFSSTASATYLRRDTASATYLPISASSTLIPSQTGNAGEFLVTDGTQTLWSSSVISPTASVSIGVRNITISTASATGGNDGDVWLRYI